MVRTRSSKEFSKQEEKQETTPAPAATAELEKPETTTPTIESKDVAGEAVVGEVSKPVYTLEDVERAKELFNEGKRHFVCGSVADAAKALSQVCQIFGAFYGETGFECAEPYYYYGRTLLDLARKEPDVVANAVEGIQMDTEGGEGENKDTAALIDDESEEQVGGTENDIREQVLDALDENTEELEKLAEEKAKREATGEASTTPAEAAAATATTATTATEDVPVVQETGEEGEKVEEDKEDEATGEDEQPEENVDEENKENDPNADQPIIEEVSNLQLAWEMLDLARVIFEKHDDEASRQRLADCRFALGEQAMEDEEFATAVEEFEKAIGLQKKIQPVDDRRIASSYVNIGAVHAFDEKYENATDAFKMAADILQARRAAYDEKLKDFNGQEKKDIQKEIEELSALIDEIEIRIQDCIDSREQTDAAKKESETAKKGDGAEAATGGGDEPPTDITHLVRKPVKRVSESGDDGTGENASKKAKMEMSPKKAVGDTIDENGHGKNGDKEVVELTDDKTAAN